MWRVAKMWQGPGLWLIAEGEADVFCDLHTAPRERLDWEEETI